MAITQLTTNSYRLKNALAFINSFSTAVNTVSGSITGTLTTSSNVVTSISSNTGVSLGQLVTADISGIANGTVVVSVNSTAVGLSQPFTGTTGSATVNTYSSTASGYYMFAGQSDPFSGGIVPGIYETPKTVEFNAYNNMLFGKAITSADVSLMVNAYEWTSGTVYAMYDDDDALLTEKAFYVYTTNGMEASNYYIFKCLFNNNGALSTAQPSYADTSPQDDYYETSDGYQWKYLYKLTAAQFNKFSTSTHIPLVEDPEVKAAATPGSIDVIVPVDINNAPAPFSGSGYNNYHSGNFSTSVLDNNSTTPTIKLDGTASQIQNFYYGCYIYINDGISPDPAIGQYRRIIWHTTTNLGTFITLESKFDVVPIATSSYIISPAVTIVSSKNEPVTATAIALVNAATSNSIYKVQVLNKGSNILSATAYVSVSPQVGVTNTATIRVISSPKGGHGSNVAAELYSSAVGISTTFANSESNTIPIVNDYQTVGIIKDPLFANVIFETTGGAGVFTISETVTQTYGNVTSTGRVTSLSPLEITDATGTFVVSPDNTAGVLVGSTSSATSQITAIQIGFNDKSFRTFDQRYKYDGTYVSGAFQENEVVYQGNVAISNATFHSNNSTGTTVYLTSKLGPIYSSNTLVGSTSGAIFNINTNYEPDLVPESGDVLYLESFDKVIRSSTQSETVKLILQY